MSQTAALILVHERIHTLNRQNPRVEVVAIVNGKTLVAGSHERVMSFAVGRTQVVGLQGYTVIPGLNSLHSHLICSGLNYNLESRWEGVPPLAGALRMSRDRADRTPPS